VKEFGAERELKYGADRMEKEVQLMRNFSCGIGFGMVVYGQDWVWDGRVWMWLVSIGMYQRGM